MPDVTSPGTCAYAISPSDTVDLPVKTRGLYVGVTGDVKVDMQGEGAGVVFKDLAAGLVHPLRVTRVYATGTTATDLVAVW